MKCVQLFWSVAFLLLCPLAENPNTLVESKVRNRVQKWQQRTWRARFGSGMRRDWKSAFDPPKSSHRSRYGLYPRADDFFTSDEVPNAYSNYHYRRVGNSKTYPKGQRSSKLASTRSRDRDVAKRTVANRLKRHTHPRFGTHVEPSEELKDYLDPLDLMLLSDDANSEIIPLQPEFEQQYIMGTEENSREIPDLAASHDTDKKLKEFKIVFHHRNLNGSGVRSGVSLGWFLFLITSTLGISRLAMNEH